MRKGRGDKGRSQARILVQPESTFRSTRNSGVLTAPRVVPPWGKGSRLLDSCFSLPLVGPPPGYFQVRRLPQGWGRSSGDVQTRYHWYSQWPEIGAMARDRWVWRGTTIQWNFILTFPLWAESYTPDPWRQETSLCSSKFLNISEEKHVN